MAKPQPIKVTLELDQSLEQAIRRVVRDEMGRRTPWVTCPACRHYDLGPPSQVDTTTERRRGEHIEDYRCLGCGARVQVTRRQPFPVAEAVVGHA